MYLKNSWFTAWCPFWLSQAAAHSSAALTASDFCPGTSSCVSLLAAKFRMNWRLEYSAAVRALMTFTRSRSKAVDFRLCSLTAAFAGMAMPRVAVAPGARVRDVDDGGRSVGDVAASRSASATAQYIGTEDRRFVGNGSLSQSKGKPAREVRSCGVASGVRIAEIGNDDSGRGSGLVPRTCDPMTAGESVRFNVAPRWSGKPIEGEPRHRDQCAGRCQVSPSAPSNLATAVDSKRMVSVRVVRKRARHFFFCV